MRYTAGRRAAGVILLLCVAAALAAGSGPARAQGPGDARDAEIQKMLSEISAPSIRASVDALANCGTRHSRSDTTSATRGIGAARRYLEAQLRRSAQASGGRMKIELDTWEDENNRIARTQFVNVMAILPAAQPAAASRWYIAGGHYDSRNSDPNDASGDAPGANDDASGTAVILELARVMASRSFDANVALVAFDGEEHGLIGSRHLARLAKERGWSVAGMITNDIVGGTLGGNGAQDSLTVRCFSGGGREPGVLDSASREWARYLKTQAERYDLTSRIRLIFRMDRFGRGGDHIPFHEEGWPALRLTEAAEDYTRQHQNVRQENGIAYGDVPAMVSADYVARVARANLAALASAAQAPALPAELKISGAVTQDTVLTWKRGAEPDLAGYAVYIRETTSPVWERRIWAGDVESITLSGVSIDNSFFGIASVDKDGHESPVALPTRG